MGFVGKSGQVKRRDTFLNIIGSSLISEGKKQSLLTVIKILSMNGKCYDFEKIYNRLSVPKLQAIEDERCCGI